MTRSPVMRLVAASALTVSVSAALAASAPASSAPGRFDGEAVRTVEATPLSGSTTRPAGGAVVSGADLDWTRVLVSLAVVIGLILLLRLAVKRWVGVGGSGTASRGVSVIGRTVLGPRQQIILLKVGRRIVVAVDNAGQLSALAQITDADEVAALIGAVESPAGADSEPARSRFARMFGAAREPYDEIEDEQPAPAVAPAANRVVGDPAVEAARGELAGLMDRIRGIAERYRKSS